MPLLPQTPQAGAATVAAKSKKPARKSGVSLVPFPWITEGQAVPASRGGSHLAGGASKPKAATYAPLARGPVALGLVELDGTADAEGNVARQAARVWRTGLQPVIASLPPEGAAALLDYAEAVHAVGASGGSSEPFATGSAPGSRSPSERALIAAERLRAMRAALDGHSLRLTPRGKIAAKRRAVLVPYADLADWIAVEGLSVDEVLGRIGKTSETARVATLAAIADVANRLALCTGSKSTDRRSARLRNMPGGRV